jgi:hypothetical protein
MPQITRNYVLHKPPPPGPWKVYLDQDVMPKVINAVTSVELGVERVAIEARKRPVAALGAALGLGYMLGVALRRRT